MAHTAHIQAWCSYIDTYTVEYYGVFVCVCTFVYMYINVEPACRVCREELS